MIGSSVEILLVRCKLQPLDKLILRAVKNIHFASYLIPCVNDLLPPIDQGTKLCLCLRLCVGNLPLYLARLDLLILSYSFESRFNAFLLERVILRAGCPAKGSSCEFLELSFR